jgi:hypothetical protein
MRAFLRSDARESLATIKAPVSPLIAGLVSHGPERRSDRQFSAVVPATSSKRPADCERQHRLLCGRKRLFAFVGQS